MLLCPACNIPLCRMDYEDVTVHFCPDCRGVLVEALRLGTIKRRQVRQWSARERRDAAARALESDRAETLRCPKCLARMVKETVPLGEGAFHVDRCDACHLAWFDAGELELVQILFEKERDSRTPEDWDRLERAAVARMHLEADKEPPVPDVPWYSPRIPLGGVGTYSLLSGLLSNLAAALVACESHDLSGASEFRRRRALFRIALALAVLVAVAAAVWFLLR